MEIFENIKVLELASVLAGPAVGTFFAELGCEVTKIENRATDGDVTRGWRLPEEETNTTSAYFASVNFGKQHHMANFHKPEDLKRIKKLASESDIVIANFRGNKAGQYGLDFHSLSKDNKGLIYCNLYGYIGDKDRPAYDAVLQAETGWMSINGTESTGPMKLPVAMIDVFAAHHMKQAILIALFKRAKTGQGSQITCTLEGSSLSNLMNQASNYLMVGKNSSLMGSLHPNIAPYGEIVEGSDGQKIMLAVGSDNQFRKLVSVLKRPEIMDDTRFESNHKRVIHRVALLRLLQVPFALKPADAWMELLEKNKIPAGKIKDLKQSLESEGAQGLLVSDVKEETVCKRITSIPFEII